MKRKCKECRECCVTLPVESLDKPGDTACQHLNSRGCGIYADRPRDCRIFNCWWLMGVIPMKFKPSRSKVVVWGTKMVGLEAEHDTDVIQANVRPGHPVPADLMALLKHLSYKHPVIIVRGKTGTLYHGGRNLGRWGEGEFVDIRREPGQPYLTHLVKIKREDLIATDADEQRWSQRVLDARTVK